MSSILEFQRLEVGFLPTLSWWGQTVAPFPSRLHELFAFLSIPFSKTPPEAPPTGHYLRTVTFDIKADNHTQTQQIA
jgi:hypothetical protein